MHPSRGYLGLMFRCHMQQIWKEWLFHRLKISSVQQKGHVTEQNQNQLQWLQLLRHGSNKAYQASFKHSISSLWILILCPPVSGCFWFYHPPRSSVYHQKRRRSSSSSSSSKKLK